MKRASLAIRSLSVALGVSLSWFSMQAARAQTPQIELIAGSGGAAPVNGTFDFLSFQPRIDNAGVVMFSGTVGGVPPPPFQVFSVRIWSGIPGSVDEVLRNGTAAPGFVTDEEFESFFSVGRAPNGKAAFTGSVTFLGDYVGAGMWEFTPGLPTLGLRTTDIFGSYEVDEFGDVAINSSGTLATKVKLEPFTPGPVPTDAAVYGAAGSVDIFLQGGDPAPGMPPGFTIAEILDSDGVLGRGVAIGDDSMLALKVWLEDPDSFLYEVIYAGLAGGLVPVAVQYFEVPGIPDAEFGELSPVPSVSSTGQVAFGAEFNDTFDMTALASKDKSDPTTLAADGSAIFVGTPGSIAPVLQSGTPVPDNPGATFVRFKSVAINPVGDLAFEASELLPDSSTKVAIWIKPVGRDPVRIVEVGDTLPTPSGNQVVQSLAFPGHGAFNAAGQIAFGATLNSSNTGIYRAALSGIVPEPPIRLLRPFVRVTRPKRGGQVTLRSRIRATGFVRSDIDLDRIQVTSARRARRSGGGESQTRRQANRQRTREATLTSGGGNRTNWQFRERLQLGRNVFRIVAIDAEGNRSVPVRLVVIRYTCKK